MEMHQIRYFLALCLDLSFTRAAKRCQVSQPSMTIAIKRLERELGGPLFERGRISTRLTELGMLVHPHLELLDRCASNARRDAMRFHDHAGAKKRQPGTSQGSAGNGKSSASSPSC